jgi:hypothetical protein
MSVTRRAQLVLGALFGMIIALTWSWAAQAQTTTEPTTSTTARASTSTTRAATSTSRPAGSTTTTATTRRPPVRLTFTASPAEGPPGTSITVSSVNQCRGVGSFYVLVSIGELRAGSGAADRVGNWRFNVTVPQMKAGTYGLAATCLISRNGVDENAGIYAGPNFTVTEGSGPPEPTTPDVHKSSSSNTGLLIGLIAAIVVAIAALTWALVLRAKHRRAAAGAGSSIGTGPSPPPGSVA